MVNFHNYMEPVAVKKHLLLTKVTDCHVCNQNKDEISTEHSHVVKFVAKKLFLVAKSFISPILHLPWKLAM